MKALMYKWFRFHSQNLAKEDRTKGWSWRCWWQMLGHDFRFEINTQRLKFGAYIELDHVDNELAFHIAPIFFQAWFTIGKVFKKSDWKKGKNLLGFSLFEEYFWIYLWTHEDGYGSSKRNWRHVTIRWKDILMGGMDYSTKPIRGEDTVIALPEATYPVHIEFVRSTWKRRRWPWKVERTQVDIKCEPGIPVPGKGENSWDCGTDHTRGLHCTVDRASTAEALGKLLEAVVSTRIKYGSGINMYAKEKETA